MPTLNLPLYESRICFIPPIGYEVQASLGQHQHLPKCRAAHPVPWHSQTVDSGGRLRRLQMQASWGFHGSPLLNVGVVFWRVWQKDSDFHVLSGLVSRIPLVMTVFGASTTCT